ncbi:hypothetical protein BJ944DRAFT_273065 [Cunninghamella echinulata]|nr:hypothetical protein BJ944DRAFT_273065 [Cunninghamella echinulata]
MNKHIIVIGCGIVGLTTAILLVEKGYKVTIAAKWLPGDRHIEYTSPFAGAHWRAMASNDDFLLQSFETISYKKFLQLGRQLPNDTGVMVVPSYDYYNTLKDVENPWFKDIVEDFSFISPSEFPNQDIKVGHKYTTVLINSPYYLNWLLKQFTMKGGKIQRKELKDIHEAFDDYVDAVVNCTGLGSLSLGGVKDTKLFPTRGQTILVRGNHIKKTITCLDDRGITYIIPRNDGTIILGGTSQKNDFNPKVDKDIAESILKRTQEICPELFNNGPLTILRHSVGLRPTRVGGVRIENQKYEKINGQPIIVTHAYGHGGFGYQSSYGSSEYICTCVEKGFHQLQKENAKL